MDASRFDALTRTLANRTTRRAAVLGGLAAVVAGLSMGRVRLPGSAQDSGTPIATPDASPFASPTASPEAGSGLLDLLTGTPPADDAALGRIPSAPGCLGSTLPCLDGPSGSLTYDTRLCCSGTCRYWLIPSWVALGSPGWYCD